MEIKAGNAVLCNDGDIGRNGTQEGDAWARSIGISQGYSISHQKFIELASRADALYRMDGTVLIHSIRLHL
ncbi:MAG: DUF6462 family protein [Chordicoccus sp.]